MIEDEVFPHVLRADTRCTAATISASVACRGRAGYCACMKTFPAFCLRLLLSAIALSFFGSLARADQIEMQNGDRYNGKVVAMTNSTLLLQSEILGTITVPREKVSQINLGEAVRATSAKPINPRTGSVQNKPLLPGAGRAIGSPGQHVAGHTAGWGLADWI